ncbi:MAG: helix-turn-helix domain-containing protein [Sphingobacteriales bacterium]
MQNKANTIGEFVKEIAESQNLKPSDLGKRINTSKQNVSDIYKRSTIDSELLLTLSKALNYNLFSYYYDKEPIVGFRTVEIQEWQYKLDSLNHILSLKEELLSQRQELVETQRKLISELGKN